MMAKQPWKPWHEVVQIRDDLKSGDLPLHMFAADLYEVLQQNGKRPIYEKPENFFALTYPTHNLRGLAGDVVKRLAGKSDKAVRQLELTYGGGKTHTLITLYHLVQDPDSLPDLPAVHEFEQSIGEKPTRARVAGLCFDKLDVEKGMEVRSSDGSTRMLKQPWSVLAYQLAGDDGLELLHADGKAEERETAPAENLLTELLEMPGKEGLSTLVLIDEVLMYAREKIAQESKFRTRLINFFQYLTQAATKVDRCCVVASLLATDPKKSDELGRQILAEMYDIFRRQKEEGVEPVVKEDVAEVLRRRFFTTDSIRDKDAFKPHVIAALKGIAGIDDQTSKGGQSAEDRFLRSFPFHPDLTEVLYEKWTQLAGFQRTRGLLRTFALALREAAQWDESPLVGPAVFLNAPGADGLSEAARELVTVADTEEHEGRKQAWTGIIDGEFGRARQIEGDSVGLKFREIEQAVMATFLHSQPVGQSAKTRDLEVLIGACRPDKIELKKGLKRWSETSYWLDDQHTTVDASQLPSEWRLGNRPNLNQMHAKAAKEISDDIVKARLIDEIGKTRSLTAGASAAGVRVHTLPTKPNDVEDDGQFHYAVLGLSAASDSGKPSAEAQRYLDETTGSDKPRVYRNAVLLVTPSKDGLEIAMARVREHMGWQQVHSSLKEQEKDGGPVDVARMQTLAMNIDKAKHRVPEAIKQAYSTVVTVSEKNEAQAFKVTVTDDPLFTTIKEDKRSRVQDTAITAEALLLGGPYALWKEGETSRRVKDLSGAFAQLPHLPKMLKADAIVDTLVEGCAEGTFVLRLTRPDHTFRTWWRSRPDKAALADPALELVLPEAAELGEMDQSLLGPGKLPELWDGDEITVRSAGEYFAGGKIVQVERHGYKEPVTIPKAAENVVRAAITDAVVGGSLWLLAGPASVLAEPIPAGVLSDDAVLRSPPAAIAAAAVLPENLPDAWTDSTSTGLSIATALSQKEGATLPWKTTKDAIGAALQARFVELEEGSASWPCEFPSAQEVKIKMASGGTGGGGGGTGPNANVLVAVAEFEPSELQDLGDAIPKLMELKAKSKLALRFQVRIELGDGTEMPTPEVSAEVNKLLSEVKDGYEVG